MEPRTRLVVVCARILVVGSLLGVLSAIGMIGWPPQVPDTQYSYPFDPATYTAAQAFFSVRHLAETAGVVALIALLWRGSGPLLRIGLVLSLIGTLLFVAMEAIAISAARVAADSGVATAVDSAYGVPTLVLGVGLVLAGIVLARSRALPGALGRWIVLISGIYVFVVLLPGLFGPEVVGRIVIGGWLLLFAGIGRSTLRAVRDVGFRAVVAA